MAINQSGLRGRLVRGFCAASLTPIVTAIFQVTSVPVFLHVWGPNLYGAWLIVSAIPNYLALSDIGFGNAAANEMTIRVGAGDRDGALISFQSTWALITAISISLGALVAIATATIPFDRFFPSTSQTIPHTRVVILLLALYALVSLQTTITMAGFRCSGGFAYGMLITNVSRLIEAVAVLTVLAAGGRPVTVAGTYFFVRMALTLANVRFMLRATPWLSYGFTRCTRASIRRLLSPALAFMALPAAVAISIQGTVLAIGAVLGPMAVATFSTMRTLTRFALLTVDALKNSFWPEMSTAVGARNMSLARSLHRRAWQATMLISASATVALVLVGPGIYKKWTHERLALDYLTFYILVAVVMCNCMWNASSLVSIAANRHQSLALTYLLSTSTATVVAAALCRSFGTAGAALTLLMVDIGMVWFVTRSALETLDDSFTEFVRALSSAHQLMPRPARLGRLVREHFRFLNDAPQRER